MGHSCEGLAYIYVYMYEGKQAQVSKPAMLCMSETAFTGGHRSASRLLNKLMSIEMRSTALSWVSSVPFLSKHVRFLGADQSVVTTESYAGLHCFDQSPTGDEVSANPRLLVIPVDAQRRHRSVHRSRFFRVFRASGLMQSFAPQDSLARHVAR